MPTLIIAEKPSLGRNIASAIGGMQRRDGYLEGNGYAVTWAFGHLFSLADVEEYTGGSGRWTLESLPCFPEKFKFTLKRSGKTVDPGVKKQFSVIKALCRRNDVDTIVNAGDADREGEIIVRLCVEHALSSAEMRKKRLLRLWLPDQTNETILSALSGMKSEAEYEHLANEGFARTYIDWLYGVNLTRYATLKTGALLRVGRVIIPIVRAIYDRDMEIRRFVPQKYYAIVSKTEHDGISVELTSKRKFAPEAAFDAKAYCDRLNSVPARVISVSSKKETLPPGKLFSLSKLQNILGKRYKMSMKESLDIVQKLYEDGYLTYPRTNSEYLATAEAGKIRDIVGICRKFGYDLSFKQKKSIFDDAKIEAHSALTPTYKIPDKTKLSAREMQVYSTVFRRFAAVFCTSDCIVERTEIKLDCGNGTEIFTLKGSVMLERGWTRYDDYTPKDKLLPKLAEGDELSVDFKPTEKETLPPKHYTIETLNNYLKNPFRDDKKESKSFRHEHTDEKNTFSADTEANSNIDTAREPEDTEEQADDSAEYIAMLSGLELGTEATRTGIIDNAKKSGYIALTKDVYTILPMGEYLIQSLAGMNIGMDKYKTAALGSALKKVYRGEYTIPESIELAKSEINAVFSSAVSFTPTPPPIDAAQDGNIVGKCPLCGSDVIHKKFGYSCCEYKKSCTFSVYSKRSGKNLTEPMIKRLLSTGTTGLLRGFTSKAGKKFDAELRLDNGNVVFFFPDNRSAQKTSADIESAGGGADSAPDGAESP